MRQARNTADELGTVRVVVHLVGYKHRHVKGNMMKVLVFRGSRVSEIVAKIHRAFMRVEGGPGVRKAV